MKLTKLGKVVLGIIDCIVCVASYILAGMLGQYASNNNFITALIILCWIRIFITPFVLELINQK